MLSKTKFATLVSVIGHPFVTVPLFVFFLLFKLEAAWKAAMLSLFIVGGIFIPISLKTYIGVRKGKYTNLDVSDQAQRQKWFIATTILLVSVTLVIWVTNQHHTLRLAMTCASVLLVIAQILNIFLKVSMHTTFHTFLGLLMLHFNWTFGVLFFLFLPLLAWSRLYLKRHEFNEVVAGMLLGGFFGAVFWFFV